MSDAEPCDSLRAKAEALRARASRIAEHAGSGDRATARTAGPAFRTLSRRTDADLRRYAETTRAASVAEARASRAEARAAERARPKLAHDDVVGASHVVDRFGDVHEVVRVNAKTVTVKTSYSFTDTIPHGKIVRAFRINPEQVPS